MTYWNHMTVPITINPKHEPLELSEQLQTRGRLQVADFFSDETADYLYRLIQENKQWHLAYNEGDNYYESELAEFQNLPPQKKQGFMNGIFSGARDHFQYVFLQYYITQAIELKENQGHPMHAMHDFVNTEETLNFMRTLTQEPKIRKADAYASCYSPGHFLTEHDDKHSKHDRVAAYVVSMTKGWNKNWGGHLAFYDEVGNIKEAFIPSFNTLNIFLIPQSHAVQQVAPFAGHARTSYLGWLHR
jgi:SM-20-related protein